MVEILQKNGNLEQDPHGAAGVGWVQLQQLLLRAAGGGREGAAVTHVSVLTLERQQGVRAG